MMTKQGDRQMNPQQQADEGRLFSGTLLRTERITPTSSPEEVRNLVFRTDDRSFDGRTGQCVRVLAPGKFGNKYHTRLYSLAEVEEGEQDSTEFTLCVRRCHYVDDFSGQEYPGVASNYLCDLKKGDKVQVIGPFGATFLMPNHPGSSLMMICTGTGSAPMRAMTERRRRRMELKEGGELMLFFGARAPDELPYFGPLMKLPKEFIDINFAFSRVPGQPKQYVQDLIRARHDAVWRQLNDADCYIYLCGLKGMEKGVDEAFRDVCRQHGGDWDALLPQLREKSRYHIETY